MKDGGSPIEEYIIEVKDPVTKDWKQIATSKTPSATITGLKENQDYQFRVRAKNKAGPGAPSEPCEKVFTERKFVPAWLDHDGLKNLVVKAGQTAKWIVKFGGRPPPDVFWFKNQQAITLTSTVQIDTKKNDHTILCIPSAVRADRGAYQLKVKNSSGEDTETADLTVLDKPSKPRGPLEVSNVTEEGCDLSWKPPEDDGGEPIDHYVVEKMDAETGKWVPCATVKDCNASVKGLKKGQNYQFRVKAVNKEGESEPLVTDTGTTAKNPYDEPGKPGVPDIVDWDANKADLKWTPPTKDGVGPECEATVTGLKEGEEYEFRVKAVNKAGPGEPSDPSRKMLAKARFQKPKIDRTAMQTVTIKVGQNVDFKVPVSGEPPPTCVWTFKDKPIDSSDPKLRITNEDYKTNFALRNATREHAGKYLLTATNDSGVDSHAVEVIVLGKPSAPGGNPLEVSDVTADHVTLDWKAPADDGGVPIDHYEVEKMDLATGRWVPCGRATDPHFVVGALQAGHEYQFRVRAVNKEGESDPLTTKDPTLAKNPFEVPDKIEKPAVLDWDKDHVDIEWKTPNDGGAPIEEFIIEKRDSNGRWVEAEHVPAGTNKATVGGLRQGEEYQFRVLAKNKAGLSEPSDPTDSVIAKPRHLAPHIHREDLEDSDIKVGGSIKFNVKIDGEPAPRVTWSFNGGEPQGVDIDSSVDYLSKFAISKAVRKQSGAYTITATNDSGTDSVTIQLKVKGRPSAPKGPLEPSNIFEDQITLDWKASEDDGGDPISHYEVERQDTRDGIWVPVGKAQDPHFVADGLTKGSHYRFRVKAVNAEGKSDPLDNKPGAPEATDWDSDHVDLKWAAPSNDGGAPIEQYQIEKRSKYGRWEPAVTAPADVLQATVPDLTKGEEYEFRVIAVNKGGPSDPSDPSKPIIAKPRNLPPKIGDVAPLKIKAGSMINFDVAVEGEPAPTISWYYPDHSEIHQGGKVKLDNDEPNKTKLQIRSTERSHSGVYTIKAVNENGQDSKEVKVVVVDKPSAPEGPLNQNNCKEPYDTAGKPGKPEVTDWGKDHADLKWTPPTDDGGAPIEEYVVEMKEKFSPQWKEVLTVPADCPQATVGNLHEGEEYEFRIVAKNKAGKGTPSDPSDAIMAKDRNVPPVIDRSALEEIRVKAGQTFQFDVPVSGEPPPPVPGTLAEEPLNRMTE
uniref:Twitchin n=1 Tax=Ditylenchus dipsaci TaxID=166011 RepID=A0A915DDF3_9BILA